MARKTWQTKADWQAGIAENLEITDAGVKLARPEPAQFTRASEAYKSDGTLVASGQPRYEGAGVLIEQGTTNLLGANGFLDTDGNADGIANGFFAYVTGAATGTRSMDTTERALGRARCQKIVRTGGAEADRFGIQHPVINVAVPHAVKALVKGQVDAGAKIRLRVSYYKTGGGWTEDQNVWIEPSGDWQEISVPLSANPESLRADYYITIEGGNGTLWIQAIQTENKSYNTSWINGTRSPETISVTVPFTPQQGGEISFRVDINDACKRQVVGKYPMLLQILRSIGGIGFELCHLPTSANFKLETVDDAGAKSTVTFADSLIPNGTRELKIDITSDFVTLYCDGQPIAQIGNGTPETKPKLPSGWGRAFLGSSASGTNQAGTTVGNLRMVVG